jgi:hypothetical protein
VRFLGLSSAGDYITENTYNSIDFIAMVSRYSVNEGLPQSSFGKYECGDWKAPAPKIMEGFETSSSKKEECTSNRIIHDTSMASSVEQRQKCLTNNIHRSSTARLRQNHQWIDALQHRSLSVLEMIAESGSIDEFMNLVEYLFHSNRVETFTLDLIVDFWAIFPEAAAQHLLKMFQLHGCWQQLLLLMERAKFKPSTGKQIWNACFTLLKDQWAADVQALARKNRPVSELALWLPRNGKHWEYQLDFRRRFTRIVYPKIQQPSEAKETYKRQCHALREAAKTNRRGRSSSTLPPACIIALASVESLSYESNRQMKRSPKKRKQRSSIPSFENIPLYDSLLLFSGQDGARVTHGLLLPIEGRVDQFLYLRRNFRTMNETFLQKPIRTFNHKSSEKVMYIHQGEVGYVLPSQCDVILSDKATTCHILSIRSSSSSQVPTLTSLAHIDGSFYSDCMVEMIETHIRHHQWNERREEENRSYQVPRGKIQLVIDMVGGFDDDRGSSAKISSWIFEVLASLAEDHQDVLTMTIRTCAISYMNDDGNQSPIGRGMGVDLRSGEAFLAQADASVVGPSSQLRSARIWAGGGNGRLAVVHRATCNDFAIQPFEFGDFDQLQDYLRMPDSKMIKRTSTSPDAEEPDFCSSVRNTLRFMKGVDCRQIFGPGVDQTIIFRRVSSSNVWHRQYANVQQ